MFNRMLSGVLMTLATSLLFFSEGAHAAVIDTCQWETTAGAPNRLSLNVGSLYVPRDAKVGDAIGPAKKLVIGTGQHKVLCATTNAQLFLNVAAIAPQLSVPGFNGTVLETNIPGIGVQLEFALIYTTFLSPTGYIVPYNSTLSFTGQVLEYSKVMSYVRLVKTADIAPGNHLLNRELAKISFTNVPDAFTVSVTGGVTQAECSLSSNPVNPAPVNLGEWKLSDFQGEGDTTTAMPFSITLNSCVADSSGTWQTTAYVRLDPAAGSTTVDKQLGVFKSSLDGIGIQVLAADGTTPVTLEEEVRQATLTPGDMTLNFNARLYQTKASVKGGGKAEGALSFTITYK